MKDDRANNSNTETRISADTKRRWEEIRQYREQIQQRQEHLINQRQQEARMRLDRILTHREAVTTQKAVPSRPVMDKTTLAVVPPVKNEPQRFDFEARRILWAQQRREHAEQRRREIEEKMQPYLENRLRLEEKKQRDRELHMQRLAQQEDYLL